MMHYVNVTSQGQITIPAKLRRKFAFDKTRKAAIRDSDNGIIIEPVKDILELEGVFKTNKRIPFRKIREAFGEYLARRHLTIKND